MSDYSAEKVDLLLGSGRQQEAIALAEGAATAGNPSALFQVASWLLSGIPLARDLPRARKLLRRAVEIGHVDAALLEIALTANGSGGSPNWVEALRLLEVASEKDSVAAAQLSLILKMNLDANGNPLDVPIGRQLEKSPDIHLFPNFVSPDECRHLAAVVHDLLEPAVVVDPVTGRTTTHPVRTSHGAVVGPARENLVVRAINLRLAAISGTAVDQGEPLSILRYGPGQQYRPHLDSIAGEANQRIKTVIVYLNQGFVGGETHFLAKGLKYVPRAGEALMYTEWWAELMNPTLISPAPLRRS